MDNETLEQLREFISEDAGISIEIITPNSDLEKDLGIYEDDALDLIAALAQKFDIDISNFIAKNYIASEGDSILPMILRSITGKEETVRKPLKITHLERAIRAGKLDEDVINS